MTDQSESDRLAKEERIRAIAYAIWEEEGRPDGRDLDHWARACELVEVEAAADPDWLQRTEAEAQPAAEVAEPATEAKEEKSKSSSIDELVNRMKGGTRAA